jgi:hypothetical protein
MKFELNDKEEKEYHKFVKRRRKEAEKKEKGSGNKIYFTICFTPTGIGDAIEVKCSDGTEKNITDYGSW